VTTHRSPACGDVTSTESSFMDLTGHDTSIVVVVVVFVAVAVVVIMG
jgi:hypothetical protein